MFDFVGVGVAWLVKVLHWGSGADIEVPYAQTILSLA